MSNTVKIEFEGIDELIEDLSDVKVLGDVLSELTKEAAERGATATRDELENRGTGMAANTIRVGPDAFNPFSHRVFTLMRKTQAQSMEAGRPSGTVLDSLTIARWLFGVRSQRRMAQLNDAQRQQVFEARNAIRSGGAKAVPMKQRGRISAEVALEVLIPKARAELIRRLSS